MFTADGREICADCHRPFRQVGPRVPGPLCTLCAEKDPAAVGKWGARTCIACGQPLTGPPEFGRCPDCVQHARRGTGPREDAGPPLDWEAERERSGREESLRRQHAERQREDERRTAETAARVEEERRAFLERASHHKRLGERGRRQRAQQRAEQREEEWRARRDQQARRERERARQRAAAAQRVQVEFPAVAVHRDGTVEFPRVTRKGLGHDFTQDRSTSVHAASAGLPGHGKRR